MLWQLILFNITLFLSKQVLSVTLAYRSKYYKTHEPQLQGTRSPIDSSSHLETLLSSHFSVCIFSIPLLASSPGVPPTRDASRGGKEELQGERRRGGTTQKNEKSPLLASQFILSLLLYMFSFTVIVLRLSYVLLLFFSLYFAKSCPG